MCAERSAGTHANDSHSTQKSIRQLQARVFLLDDSVHTFSINSCALGSELFLAIIEKQKILESDYFDLEYVNVEGVRCWIDHNKNIVKQVGTGKDLVFIFAVKFYTPHPNLLEEEYTRFLFALQIKRDIVSGQLICSTNTAALLASYIVQAEIGDFLEDVYTDNNYLRQLKLVNQPNDDILNKIMEFHKTHIGTSPSEADFHLLDTARKIEYYGVKMHLAKDHENLPLNLSVTHMGVVVFQNLTKINTFSWAKIRKLSFKRKKFLIKLHPEGYGYYKGMVEFYFETRNDCKRFWKKCIEYHSFFRCPASDHSQRKKPHVVTKGSSFRFSGRTQKELIEYVRENYSARRDHFERPTKAKLATLPHNGKNARGGMSYQPFTLKGTHSAPSRAVSDSSELNRTGMAGNVGSASPRAPGTASALNKPRWSKSVGHSPRDDSRETKEEKEITELNDSKENNSVLNSNKVQSQKRSKKSKKVQQECHKDSSDEEADDKKVELSNGRVGSNANGHLVDDEPLPAKEAFRGTDRLCRQRASIGGFGDVSDSDQGISVARSHDRPRPTKPVRQASEPASRGSDSPSNATGVQDTKQKVVCIDQYRSRRHRNPDSLHRSNQALVSAKRFKSTPNDVAGNTRLDALDKMDSKQMLADIPYVLLRRHKSPEQPGAVGSIKSASHSRRSLLTKSLKSVKDIAECDRPKEQSFGKMRQSKSLDRRLAGIGGGSNRHIVAPKSPKLLREEYMQSQRRTVSDRATIEALKNQLRASSSVRNMGRAMNGDAILRGQANGPMFVSAYRLPPVNNFSAKDDTMSPQTRDLDRIYNRMKRRGRVTSDSNQDTIASDKGLDHDINTKRHSGMQRQQTKTKVTTAPNDIDDHHLNDSNDLESLLGILPGNPIYLDSSSSSEDGEFDISPDRCSRPRSVSENEFKLRTPRSSRRSSVCRGHNSSLSLTDSSFNSDDSFLTDDDGDFSGSPYSFLADCSQNQSLPQKNVKGSSGDSSQLPDDNARSSQFKSDEVNLQILEAPVLPEDSTDDEMAEKSPSVELPISGAQDSMSIDDEDSPSVTTDGMVEYNESLSNTSSSDQVMVVAGVCDFDTTVVDQKTLNIDPVITTKTEPTKDTSLNRVLDTVLQKRVMDSPFMRTSTPTKEYSSNNQFNAGSTDRRLQNPAIQVLNSLKSAISAPGLTTDRESSYSPTSVNVRHSSTSPISINSSSSTSMSNTNPTPALEPDTSTIHCPEPSSILIEPDIITANRVPNPRSDEIFNQPTTPEPLPSIINDKCSHRNNNDFPLDLVILNEAAFSSISDEKCSIESGDVDNIQAVSENEVTRPELLDDTREGQTTNDHFDDYILPSEHRSISPASMSSSAHNSDSVEYPKAPQGAIIVQDSIEDNDNELSTSPSESSEEVEPFPPPPSQSDLLIFDERDEDIFQQMQQRNSNFKSSKDPHHTDSSNQYYVFPKPPSMTPSYSSTHTPVVSRGDQSPPDSTLQSNTQPSIDLIEQIKPRFTSLLYDKDYDECYSVDIHERNIDTVNASCTRTGYEDTNESIVVGGTDSRLQSDEYVEEEPASNNNEMGTSQCEYSHQDDMDIPFGVESFPVVLSDNYDEEHNDIVVEGTLGNKDVVAVDGENGNGELVMVELVEINDSEESERSEEKKSEEPSLQKSCDGSHSSYDIIDNHDVSDSKVETIDTDESVAPRSEDEIVKISAKDYEGVDITNDENNDGSPNVTKDIVVGNIDEASLDYNTNNESNYGSKFVKIADDDDGYSISKGNEKITITPMDEPCHEHYSRISECDDKDATEVIEDITDIGKACLVSEKEISVASDENIAKEVEDDGTCTGVDILGSQRLSVSDQLITETEAKEASSKVDIEEGTSELYQETFNDFIKPLDSTEDNRASEEVEITDKGFHSEEIVTVKIYDDSNHTSLDIDSSDQFVTNTEGIHNIVADADNPQLKGDVMVDQIMTVADCDNDNVEENNFHDTLQGGQSDQDVDIKDDVCLIPEVDCIGDLDTRSVETDMELGALGQDNLYQDEHDMNTNVMQRDVVSKSEDKDNIKSDMLLVINEANEDSRPICEGDKFDESKMDIEENAESPLIEENILEDISVEEYEDFEFIQEIMDLIEEIFQKAEYELNQNDDSVDDFVNMESNDVKREDEGNAKDVIAIMEINNPNIDSEGVIVSDITDISVESDEIVGRQNDKDSNEDPEEKTFADLNVIVSQGLHEADNCRNRDDGDLVGGDDFNGKVEDMISYILDEAQDIVNISHEEVEGEGSQLASDECKEVDIEINDVIVQGGDDQDIVRGSDDIDNEEIEEIIVPRHCTLLYDEDTEEIDKHCEDGIIKGTYNDKEEGSTMEHVSGEIMNSECNEEGDQLSITSQNIDKEFMFLYQEANITDESSDCIARFPSYTDARNRSGNEGKCEEIVQELISDNFASNEYFAATDEKEKINVRYNITGEELQDFHTGNIEEISVDISINENQTADARDNKRGSNDSDIDIGTEEIIIPRYSSLLYEDDAHKSETNSNTELSIDDVVEYNQEQKEAEDTDAILETEEVSISKDGSFINDECDNEVNAKDESSNDVNIEEIVDDKQDVDNTDRDIDTEEIIEARYCSSFHEEGVNIEGNTQNDCLCEEIEVEEIIVPIRSSLLFDVTVDQEGCIDNNTVENKDTDSIYKEKEVEEVIVQKHSSLLYDQETYKDSFSDVGNQGHIDGNIEENKNTDSLSQGMEVEDIIVPSHCSLLYTGDVESDRIIDDSMVSYCTDIVDGYDNRGGMEEVEGVVASMKDIDGVEFSEHMEENSVSSHGKDEAMEVGEGSSAILPMGGIDGPRVSLGGDGFPVNDPLPFSFDVSELSCQSPEGGVDEGEC